jgi:hypothetical protein
VATSGSSVIRKRRVAGVVRNPSISTTKPACPGVTSTVSAASAGTTSGGALPPCIASGVQTNAGVPKASSGPPPAIE